MTDSLTPPDAPPSLTKPAALTPAKCPHRDPTSCACVEQAPDEPSASLPRVKIELPDGDKRTTKVWFTEWRDGELHVCVQIEESPLPPDAIQCQDSDGCNQRQACVDWCRQERHYQRPHAPYASIRQSAADVLDYSVEWPGSSVGNYSESEARMWTYHLNEAYAAGIADVCDRLERLRGDFGTLIGDLQRHYRAPLTKSGGR